MPLILARALHFASLVSLAGSLAFLALIPAPVEAAGLRRPLLRLAWASLAVALLSGALWLLLEGESMSGRPLATVLAQGIVAVVLERTRFGHDWLARGAAALVLVPALAAERRRPALWLALAASAAMLGGLAWAGHAEGTPGEEGALHLVSDVPLALLFARALAQPALLDAARAGTRRFSLLGMISVGTLLATGIVNSWILVGTVPGLIGTSYGQLLLLKIASFTAMATLAAINRQRLTPALHRTAAPLAALRQLRRNALIEVALGLFVLAIVGALGILPPGMHSEPVWPLPFLLDTSRLALGGATTLLVVLTAIGLAAFASGALQRRWLTAMLGLTATLGFGWLLVRPMVEPAYPTSFAASPVAYDTSSIARGAQIYAANCALCHGVDGRGDGPAAANLPRKPATLTAAHLLTHRVGDLFWWISHGRSQAMPAFADILSAQQRWDAVNFIRARAFAAQPDTLAPEVRAHPAPLAPDFVFERGNNQGSLYQTLAGAPVLLVLYRLPAALPRLKQLAAEEPELAEDGVRLLALPLDPAATDGEAAPKLPDFAASSDAATLSAYGLFTGPGKPADIELLIDRATYIRARWRADAPPLPSEATLLTQLARIQRLPLAAPAMPMNMPM
jgi:putative copper export protein/mono/diheme cytochrome c family protein